ncbi:MAG: hypothetical protein WCC66_12365 [Rhizobiaceae bacterium]
MFWKRLHSKLIASPDFENNREYSELKKQLFETPIHTPSKHPINLPNDDDGLGWAAGIKHRRWAFNYFRKFDDWINMLYDPDRTHDFGPWRIEQQSDPFLLNFGIEDGPVVGLRYRIFYNSECVGDLEISPDSEEWGSKNEGSKRYGALINVSISNAPFLPHDHVRGFLNACLERFRNNSTGVSPRQAVYEALSATLWESNRNDSMWVDLDLRYSGYVEFGED